MKVLPSDKNPPFERKPSLRRTASRMYGRGLPRPLIARAETAFLGEGADATLGDHQGARPFRSLESANSESVIADHGKMQQSPTSSNLPKQSAFSDDKCLFRPIQWSNVRSCNPRSPRFSRWYTCCLQFVLKHLCDWRSETRPSEKAPKCAKKRHLGRGLGPQHDLMNFSFTRRPSNSANSGPGGSQG